MAANRTIIAIYALGFAFGVLVMFLILVDPADITYLYRYVLPGHQDSVIPWSSSSSNDNPTLAKQPLKLPTSTEKAKQQRLLCWIMTTNFTLKGKTVKETWGKRCDVLLFLSSKTDPDSPATIGLDVGEGRDELWDKTRAAWDYVYQHHLHDAEWFLKADDETYMIIENLRYLLSNYNPAEPHFVGRYFKDEGEYKGEGLVYIFSREVLDRFKKALGKPTCTKENVGEGEALETCVKALGVLPTDTRDSMDRETFLIFPGEENLKPGFWEKIADRAISFHNIEPGLMHHMEYFVYRQSVLPEP